MKKIIIAFLLFCSPNVAGAENWVVFKGPYLNTFRDTVQSSYDKDSINNLSNKNFRVWEKMHIIFKFSSSKCYKEAPYVGFLEATKINNCNVYEWWSLIEINCQERMKKKIYLKLYNSNKPFQSTEPYIDKKWHYIEPSDSEEILRKIICQ